MVKFLLSCEKTLDLQSQNLYFSYFFGVLGVKKFLIFLLLSYFFPLLGDLALAPVSYKGRIRPLRVYTENVFYDFYHAFQATPEDALLFNTKDPLYIISKLYVDGYEKWQNAPLIWIGDKKVKKVLQLDPNKQRFSFKSLKNAFHQNPEPIKIIAHYYFKKNSQNSAGIVEIKELAIRVNGFTVLDAAATPPWSQLKVGDSFQSSLYETHLAENLIKILQKLSLFETFKGIQRHENQPELSFKEQLKGDPHFHLLPGRYLKGEWFGLGALTLNDRNFTLYKDASFQPIRDSFLNWTKEIDAQTSDDFSQALLHAYSEIAKEPFLKSGNNQTFYPSFLQLQLELKYSSLPLIQISIVGYLLALFFFLSFPDHKRFKQAGYTCFVLAFFLQLSSLLVRSWILMRPPVSNMFETVIYVPFVGAVMAMILAKRMKSQWPLLASALLSSILLTVIEISDLNRGLENVQAVLNSNFWLVIHVLMIVGSYGILILAGVFSHFYLLALWRDYKDKQILETCIIQSLYLGVALLIPGTILGGVWAAQSWGRFWDWDPKESWAFISICTYLILIHLYRFNKIGVKGLSFGAIIGLGIISFTWYGVNYILGTGMHTYGFGSGSHVYYLIFLLAESVFLIYMALKLRKNFLCKTHLGYIKD